MNQIPFHKISNRMYVGFFTPNGYDMVNIVRPTSGYLAIGTFTAGDIVSGMTLPNNLEEIMKIITKYTCFDYENSRTKANQSFTMNYPEDVLVVILSNCLPICATTLTGNTEGAFNTDDTGNDNTGK